jgi:hypothetical protein
MTPYPTEIHGAVGMLIGAATTGIQPDGQHGDLACCLQAAWNVQGFGLALWKPHDHPDLKAAPKGKKGPAKGAGVPKGEKAQLAKLAKLLEPAAKQQPQGVTVGADGKPATPPAGDHHPDHDNGIAALPWDQIIALAVVLIQAWLKRK